LQIQIFFNEAKVEKAKCKYLVLQLVDSHVGGAGASLEIREVMFAFHPSWLKVSTVPSVCYGKYWDVC
jgi:hypothetical protein